MTSDILDSSPSIVNINITCHSGSSVSLTNNVTIPENTNTEELVTEFSNGIPMTQTQTQPQTQTTQTIQTTQNANIVPISNNPPPGLLPPNSRVFLTVNPASNPQNINNITQNLLNSLFSGANNTTTESVTFIPNTQNTLQMQPPSDGLNLNDLRNYTALTTHVPNTSGENPAAEINCEICHDSIKEGEILRMINVCNHSFHQECVDSWFENNTICPYCRGNVMEEIINTDDATDVGATENTENTENTNTNTNT
jgi:hypothetical protein